MSGITVLRGRERELSPYIGRASVRGVMHKIGLVGGRIRRLWTTRDTSIARGRQATHMWRYGQRAYGRRRWICSRGCVGVPGFAESRELFQGMDVRRFALDASAGEALCDCGGGVVFRCTCRNLRPSQPALQPRRWSRRRMVFGKVRRRVGLALCVGSDKSRIRFA